MDQNNKRLVKNSKKMMFIYGFLGIFMIVAVLSTVSPKPTYSAYTCSCASYGSGWTLTAQNKCLKSSTNSVTCYQNSSGDGCAQYTDAGYTCTVVNASSQGASYSCSKETQEIKDAVCTWKAACYVYNGKYIWATTSDQAQGNLVGSYNESDCTGCASGYHLSGSNCVRDGSDSGTTKTITFKSNGGKEVDRYAQCTIAAGATTCSITTPSAAHRDDYTFLAWGTSASCTSGNEANTTMTVNANTPDTYYACWKGTTTGGTLHDGECSAAYTEDYLVATFTGSGSGDCGHTYSCKYSSKADCESKTGYICESKTKTGTLGSGGGGSITCYGSTGEGTGPVNVTMTFDANGGSGGKTETCTVTGKTVKCSSTGSDYVIAPSAPIRSGYDFLGWGVTKTCGATGVTAGSQVVVGVNGGTRYACWTPTGTCSYTGIAAGNTLASVQTTESCCKKVGWNWSNGNCTTAVSSDSTSYYYSNDGFSGWCATQSSYHLFNGKCIKCKSGYSFDDASGCITEDSPKTVTLTFKSNDGSTTIGTKSCTIAANKTACDEDLVAPSASIPQIEGKVFNGWGNSANCTTGDYMANATFHVTRASYSKSYYACYIDDYDDTTDSDWSSSKCFFSEDSIGAVGVTRDERYLRCTYTNISYNNDPDSSPGHTTGDARGNIKKCCLSRGYTWVADNYTTSGFGNEYCIKCGGGSVEPPSGETIPTTSCYECKVNGANKYTYASSSVAAATATGGTSCNVTNSSNCSSGTKVTNCYACITGVGRKYTFSDSETTAKEVTGGSSCSVISDTYCTASPVNSCYGCDVNGKKKYVMAKDATEASSRSGGNNCDVVLASYCNIDVNPKTGGGNLHSILAILLGTICLVYSIWYLSKASTVK